MQVLARSTVGEKTGHLAAEGVSGVSTTAHPVATGLIDTDACLVANAITVPIALITISTISIASTIAPAVGLYPISLAEASYLGSTAAYLTLASLAVQAT